MGARRSFHLSDCDRENVSKIIKDGREGRTVVRAIVLKMKDKNYTHAETAEIVGVTPRTVVNICNYYDEGGLESALNDDPRPGAPPKFDTRVKAQIVAMVCSEPPKGFDRWTLELIQEEFLKYGSTGTISKEKIRIILKEHDFKPWLQKMWCVPRLDEEYINRMESILDLYERGDSKDVPLVCIDEKTVHLRSDAREAILSAPRNTKKVDYEYRRNGTANVFFSVEPFGGFYVVEVTDHRTKKDFGHFLERLSKKYAKAKKIMLVMDNLNTHNKSSLEEAFGKKEADKIWNRFEIYYTPKHASWLYMAEMGIGMYSRQCLGKTRISNVKTLKWFR